MAGASGHAVDESSTTCSFPADDGVVESWLSGWSFELMLRVDDLRRREWQLMNVAMRDAIVSEADGYEVHFSS